MCHHFILAWAVLIDDAADVACLVVADQPVPETCAFRKLVGTPRLTRLIGAIRSRMKDMSAGLPDADWCVLLAAWSCGHPMPARPETWRSRLTMQSMHLNDGESTPGTILATMLRFDRVGVDCAKIVGVVASAYPYMDATSGAEALRWAERFRDAERHLADSTVFFLETLVRFPQSRRSQEAPHNDATMPAMDLLDRYRSHLTADHRRRLTAVMNDAPRLTDNIALRLLALVSTER